MNHAKLGSLFDGSGGFPLAGSLCGIEPRWASEVEPYPIAVTRSRFPQMKHLGDISKVSGADIEPVDIITFGSPCQDLSVAGKQKGIQHTANGDEETTRSGLFLEAVRIIKEMRQATNGEYPSFCIWENVPGAFSSNRGADFRVVLEEMLKIVEPSAPVPEIPKNGWPYADYYSGDGWSLAYRLFDAQHWGVPQRRRRIYLVLDLRGERALEVLFEREGLLGYLAPSREEGQDPPADAQASLGADDRKGEGCDLYNQALTGDVAISIRCRGDNEHTPCVIECVGIDGYNADTTGDKAATLGVNCGVSTGRNGVVYSVENHPNDSRVRIDADGRVQALTSRMGTGGGNVPMVMEPSHTSVRIQGSMIGRKDENGPQGDGVSEGVSFTLNTIDRHGVAYAVDQGAGKSSCSVLEDLAPTLATTHDGAPAVCLASGKPTVGTLMANASTKLWTGNQEALSGDYHVIEARPAGVCYTVDEKCGNTYTWRNQANTLAARDFKQPQAVAYGFDPQAARDVGQYFHEDTANPLVNGSCPGWHNGVVETAPPSYIVRRLTPTECARLQGFPDWWSNIDPKETFTADELAFWLEVRKTYDRIQGRKEKDYTEKQMLRWYNSLHTDAAEYKMWGNGIALPTALYCMEGIAEALKNQKSKKGE